MDPNHSEAPDEILEEALKSLGLTVIRPDDLRGTVELLDCGKCFSFTAMLVDSEYPLWWAHLMSLEYHSTSHGGNN